MWSWYTCVRATCPIQPLWSWHTHACVSNPATRAMCPLIMVHRKMATPVRSRQSYVSSDYGPSQDGHSSQNPAQAKGMRTTRSPGHHVHHRDGSLALPIPGLCTRRCHHQKKDEQPGTSLAIRLISLPACRSMGIEPWTANFRVSVSPARLSTQD